MATKALAPVLDIKEISDDGQFEGYGSIFGNKDRGGDIVVAGAFTGSLVEHRQRGTSVKMFWQHDPHQPIGKWVDMAEDAKGLYVKGRLNMGVQRAREAHALLKEGDIDGLSIGYSVLDGEPDDSKNAFMLKKVRLFEISIVSIPMNERARIDAVKAAAFEDFARRLRDGEPPSTKEFEDILREAGVPKSMATQIASVGYAKAIRREAGGDQANIARFLDELKRNPQI